MSATKVHSKGFKTIFVFVNLKDSKENAKQLYTHSHRIYESYHYHINHPSNVHVTNNTLAYLKVLTMTLSCDEISAIEILSLESIGAIL